jgi:hypothetical protein
VTSNSSRVAIPCDATVGRFRLDYKQVLAPALWPEQAKPDPKDSISISEARVGVGAQDDLKLMAKDEILESEVTTRPQAGEQGAEK